MDEEQADAVASALGGETWQSGGDMWLVLLKRADDKVVVISDEIVYEYKNDEAFEQSKASLSITLH